MKPDDIDLHRNKIIRDAAGIAFNLIKDSALLMKRTYNLWTVLEILQEYMKVSDMKSDHRIEAGNSHVFMIQHELGENWSLFTKELLNLIFENLASARPERNHLVIKVRNSNFGLKDIGFTEKRIHAIFNDLDRFHSRSGDVIIVLL
jgi:hypothetical protein